MEFKGLTALVTGASRGLGAAIARKFVDAGANVCMTARSLDLLQSVQASLLERSGENQKVLAIRTDVSETKDIDTLVDAVVGETGRLDILINNASIFGPMGKLEDVSWSAWVETMNVNLLGTVYTCRAAIPHLRKSERGKIINVSGGGATRAFPSLAAYATSKAAIIRFTEEIAEELRPDRIDVNSIAPGPLNTRFVDEAIAAGPERLGQSLYNEILRIRESGGTPFELGANACAYLASRRSDGITGKSISARYDDWEKLHEMADDLGATELYTMRRIDPNLLERMGKKYSGD